MTEDVVIVNDPPDAPAAETTATARRARFRDALAALGNASSRDLIRWVLLPASIAVIVGFNLMIFGWWGAARTAREIEQIPYLISGGLLGLGFVVIGALLLVTALWAAVTGRMTREAEERHRSEMAALEARLSEMSSQVAAAVERSAAGQNGPVRSSTRKRTGPATKATGPRRTARGTNASVRHPDE